MQKSRLLNQWFGSLDNITRLSIRRELIASVPLSIVVGVMSASFSGFVARKALGFSDNMLSLLMAGNMAGLFLSGFLVGYFHSSRKALALAKSLAVISAVLFTVAFTPSLGASQRWGPFLFIAQILLAQTSLALALTLRSSVWRCNYPDWDRGKIVVLIYLLISCVSSLSIFLFTFAMDYWSMPFQAVYVFSGFAALASAFFFAKVRIRKEKQIRKNQAHSKHLPILSGLTVLKTDDKFRHFMGWQMLNGLSTLVIETSVIVIIINDVFKSSWLVGGSALTVISLVVGGVSGIFWSRTFDRWDISTMRFIGALIWGASRLTFGLGVYLHSIEIVLLSRAFTGIALGLGQLNWRLGHMAFASPEKDSLYMGAHISLTGIRGIIAPFLGVYLYKLFNDLPHLGSNGVGIIGLSSIGQIIAGFGFLHMKQSHNNAP